MTSAISRAINILIYIFLLAPLVVVVIASFSGSAVLSFPPTSLSTHSYKAIEPAYVDSLYISMIVACAATAIAVLVGVPAGIALSRTRFPGRDALGTLCLSPLMIPTLVIGVALYQFSVWIWSVSGVTLGGTITGLVIGHLTFAIPFVVRAVVAADARSDHSLEEASQNLGATPRQTFFMVALPLLKSGVAVGSVFAFLASFDEVPISLLMGGGYATTLPVRMFSAIAINFSGDIMAVAALVVLASTALMLALDRTIGLESFFGATQ